jgi:hypothetical protein
VCVGGGGRCSQGKDEANKACNIGLRGTRVACVRASPNAQQQWAQTSRRASRWGKGGGGSEGGGCGGWVGG